MRTTLCMKGLGAGVELAHQSNKRLRPSFANVGLPKGACLVVTNGKQGGKMQRLRILLIPRFSFSRQLNGDAAKLAESLNDL